MLLSQSLILFFSSRKHYHNQKRFTYELTALYAKKKKIGEKQKDKNGDKKVDV